MSAPELRHEALLQIQRSLLGGLHTIGELNLQKWPRSSRFFAEVGKADVDIV